MLQRQLGLIALVAAQHVRVPACEGTLFFKSVRLYSYINAERIALQKIDEYSYQRLSPILPTRLTIHLEVHQLEFRPRRSRQHSHHMLGGATATTTAEMTSNSRSSVSSDNSREQSPISNSTSQPAQHKFIESQCLFCDQESPDISQNVTHMSKAHGLHIELSNLLVEVVDLLSYFHLIISECYECLYCGTQRNTRQAAQQHMMSKESLQIRHHEREWRRVSRLLRFLLITGLKFGRGRGPLTHNPRTIISRPAAKAQKATSTKAYCKETIHEATNSATPTPTEHHTPTQPDELQQQLSARAFKQSQALSSHLSHLRASDRASLAHLPTSQQRALLSAHHKQMIKDRKQDATRRGRLESAANLTGRLDKVRLVRVPPHLGHVQTLKR